MAETNIPPWGSLPTEALEAIFRHLRVAQLRQLRLMCRHWNSAICHSPALMKKFTGRFDEKHSTVFQTASAEQQLKLASNLTLRLSKVCLDMEACRVMTVSPLWSKMAETIRTLNISGYKGVCSVGKLIQVLRMLPNLVCLDVSIDKSSINCEKDINIDFQLDRLETLELRVHDARFVHIFSKICTKLKVFKFEDTLTKKLTAGKIMPIIYSNQDSLQQISMNVLHLNDKTLRQICLASRLQLKKLSLEESGDFNERGSIHADVLAQLCKAFPMIESLEFETVSMESAVLQALSQNLKQLRELSMDLELSDRSKDLKVFLEKMPQLESLSVNFGMDENDVVDLDLCGIGCPNLKKLKLSNFIYSEGTVGAFLRKSPNIRHLSFNDFTIIGNIVQVLQTLSAQKTIEHLEISQGDFREMDGYGVLLKNVRTLETDAASLITCCPNLETLDLMDVSVRDVDVLWLLQALPNLKDLSIHPEDVLSDGNQMTDGALDHLVAHGRGLKKLYLTLKASQTSQVARDRLVRALQGADVHFMVDTRERRVHPFERMMYNFY